MAKQKKPKNCLCDSGLLFEQCCQPLLNETRLATSALALMRSRYSAYVLADEGYLLKTWHSDTRPQQLELDQNQQQWRRLKIVDTELGTPDDETGMVEFIATFKLNGRAEHLRERSRFSRENGQWVYIDGIHQQPTQL
ncbi:MAG: hypothetical protein KUG72_12540 [Pseudomonadales bacterium]|nr:hypothetical protein [Pseudomonadales bacterium]